MVTVALLRVGPGLLVLPGLVLLGIEGTEATPGVWKYSGVVKDEQPALVQAATFQRYCLPVPRLSV